MELKEWNPKPRYHDCDSTDEEVLHAIANRKELEGFKPIYLKVDPTPVTIKIVGYIENVESKFIDFAVKGNSYTEIGNVYSLSCSQIALDEYKNLRQEFSDHAKFQKPDRNYLRLTQINGHYVFGDHKPFGDRAYVETFTDLEEAINKEQEIREIVRRIVNRIVFKKAATEYKNLQILSHLSIIRKLKSAKAKNEMIDILIKDLDEYHSKTKN